ncbi:GrpB family protein [Brevundimonas naejangsanensis]|uniref:GrpB family protein n=1 Tax=Brevundimonas naejangsanensis TaxID=588932 RepID=UPI003208E89B
MPPPFRVELELHDPAWPEQAERETARLYQAFGPALKTVHHIGSTAIPGIAAKPVLDLMPVAGDLSNLDDRRAAIEALGYEWWGEYGLPGRRYLTLSDPATGRRLVQVHAYAEGSREITRHLAFRDYLRANPAIAADYDAEKARCRAAHPDDSHAYGDCKSNWVQAIEADALNWAAASSD